MKTTAFQGIWRYTWQMLALLVIASVAIHSTVSFLEDQIAQSPEGKIFPFGTMLAFWAMVIGFMFLIGGLALWTLQFATESESLRRVGNVIDAMNMLQDALISTDRKGRITGSNPAAGLLSLTPLKKGDSIRDGFPCLTEEDLELFGTSADPVEVERTLVKENSARTLRFRSQSSDGMPLIFISDVTLTQLREQRRQQLAR